MKNTYSCLTLMMLIALASCSTGKVVSSASVKYIPESSVVPANTLTYTLPKTVLRVEVETEKMVCKPGPFFNYSERYLNVTNVVTEEKETWQIKSIRVAPVGVADKSRRFGITTTGAAAMPNISMTEDGVLLGVNINPVAASEAVSKEFGGDDVLAKNITFDSVPLLEKQLKTTSLAMMAESVANHIYKLRKRQLKLIGFEYEHHPSDGTAMKYSIEELKKQEEIFTEMFVGKCEKQTIVQSFDIVPDSVSMSSSVLFRFSRQLGLVSKEDLSGSPVYYEYVTAKRRNVNASGLNTSLEKDMSYGLFYSQPAQIDFKLIHENRVVLEQPFSIAQLGSVTYLPVESIMKPNVVIMLDPATGALKRIGKLGE